MIQLGIPCLFVFTIFISEIQGTNITINFALKDQSGLQILHFPPKKGMQSFSDKNSSQGTKQEEELLLLLIFKPCSESLVNGDFNRFSFHGKIIQFLEFHIM